MMNSLAPVILCVDDEESYRSLLETILTTHGYKVVSASSGLEALQKVKRQAIDLVLLDASMPGMDGFEVCRQMKEDPKLAEIPVIMVTGLTSSEAYIRGIEVGVEDYFTKPFQKAELLARIKILLKVKRLGDERRRAEEALKKSYDELDDQVKSRTAELEKANQMLQTDILKRKRVEERLRESESKYYDLYNNAPEMYYSLDLATGIITECNISFMKTTGYNKEELIGRPIFELYDTESATSERKALGQLTRTGEIRDAERRVKCKDGRIIDVSLNVSSIRGKEGKLTYTRSIWHDITERKAYEEMIRALSITDPLTNLYNRRGFMTLAEQQLRTAERTKSRLLLLYADLDGLKEINDRLGHKSGDEAIVEASNVLREVFRKMDIIARIGGDEFAVLAPEASLEHSQSIRHRLKDRLDQRNARRGKNFNISMSVGTTDYDPATPRSLDEMISCADSRMYEQKRRKVH